MDESYTGGDVIVQALKAAGVEYVFGIISIHNYRVTRVEAFRPAIESALTSGRLSLVEIDMGAVGPFSVPFAGYALNN